MSLLIQRNYNAMK